VPTGLGERMVRAARLDPHLYEEVEADPAATRQAALVVVLAALAAGLGGGGHGPGALLVGAVVALGAWYLWAFLIYWIGTRLLPEPGTQADHGQVLRAVGFAAAPGVLRVLGIVPGLRGLAFLVGGVWMLVATVVAVRQALDYRSTARAVAVSAVGWLVQAVVVVLLLALLGRR